MGKKSGLMGKNSGQNPKNSGFRDFLAFKKVDKKKPALYITYLFE